MSYILRLEKISKTFKKGKLKINVLNNISFSLYENECFGIIGQSGSGKSTLINIIAGLEKADNGFIEFLEKKKIHMVFQNPIASFNPKMKIGTSIMEGMRNIGISRLEAEKKMKQLLNDCGLLEEYSSKYPHQLSGGECQRAALARAIACNPDILICDEITSALDVNVQNQILELLQHLKKEKNITILFVCHDLKIVEKMCSRMIVLHEGKIIEEGIVNEIICNPQQEYTKQLLEAVL